MTAASIRSWLPLVVLVTGAYVLVTSAFLPPVVASHFDAAGNADAYMSRGGYAAFMAGLSLALPVLVVCLPNVMLRRGSRWINLPHRDYWLAPERREATVDYLCRHNAVLGALVTGFLGYVHGLVLQANSVLPPRLSAHWLIVGMAAFVAVLTIWSVQLLRRFRRVPRGEG
jgi:hypothetical protein